MHACVHGHRGWTYRVHRALGIRRMLSIRCVPRLQGGTRLRAFFKLRASPEGKRPDQHPAQKGEPPPEGPHLVLRKGCVEQQPRPRTEADAERRGRSAETARQHAMVRRRALNGKHKASYKLSAHGEPLHKPHSCQEDCRQQPHAGVRGQAPDAES